MQVERVAEPDGGRGLAFARGRRRDRRDQHQLAVRPAVELRQVVERYLGLVLAVGLERFLGNAEPLAAPRR